MNRATKYAIVLIFGILLITLAGCGGAADCNGRADLSREDLLECVSGAGAWEHLLALQEIADSNEGNRAAGTPGYEDSVSYVVEILQAAGYEVELHEFDFRYEPLQALRQLAPVESELIVGRVAGTGFGRVSGPVIPVDLALGQEPWPDDVDSATSGCEIEDFHCCDFSGPNDIAMVQGGACLSSKKAVNAEAAGAEAMIILIVEEVSVHPIAMVDRINLNLDGSPSHVTIPVVGARLSDGIPLSQNGAQAVVQVPAHKHMVQHNVLAELPGHENGQIIVAGAHLDSVLTAPGISDNGSGSAALLETAVQMADMTPRNTVRFAWWGAEEAGLVGSSAYVEGLTKAEQAEIVMYLNFDMIASPNPAIVFYEDEASDKIFESYYAGRRIPFEKHDGVGPSDFLPFKAAGMPVAALNTGAHCNHQPCDTVDNIDMEMLDVNSDAVAYAVYHYATQGE